MANPPGSEFGDDFFKYVLGPVGETLTNFASTALPTSSGVPAALGIPGVTTPGIGPMGVPGAGPDPGFLLPQGGQATGPLGRIFGAQPDYKAPQAPPPQSAASVPQTTGTQTGTGTGYAQNVQRFTAQIKQAAADTGVPERVLASIVHIECPACDPSTVRSDSHAAGIAQVVGGPVDPLENLRAAGRLLREKQRIFGLDPNDWNSTAAAYFGAYRPGVGITGDRDQTGTNGFSYVDKFANAYKMYPDVLGGNVPAPSTSASAQPATVTGAPQQGYANIRPSQFDPWLSKDEQLAACGPTSVAAFAGISVREALDKAKQIGVWDDNVGMHGIQGEKILLDSLQVPNEGTTAFNNIALQQALAQGKSVIVSTGYVSPSEPGHYFIVDGYQNGKYHVGTSGTDLKSGSDYMLPAEMARTGPIQGMIVVDK